MDEGSLRAKTVRSLVGTERRSWRRLTRGWIPADCRWDSRHRLSLKTRTKLPRLTYPVLYANPIEREVSCLDCGLTHAQVPQDGHRRSTCRFVKRAMKLNPLRDAVRAGLCIVRGAPGCAAISAKTREICGSLSMEKRSTHELNDRRDRRNRATITCFNKADDIAPEPTSRRRAPPESPSICDQADQSYRTARRSKPTTFQTGRPPFPMSTALLYEARKLPQIRRISGSPSSAT